MDKISIIIPVYNVENFLEKCLDSVINQTYKNLEIICVNDGSKDNSLKILNEYAKKDERICVVNKKNGGLSSARNAGLDIASGKYCYFLDSDDWIELNTIELLVEKMTTNDVDVVVHGIKNICYDEQSRQIVQDCENWLNSFNKEQGVFFVPLEINEKIPCVAWNKLYKMEIINKYNCRFPEGLINEDEAFIWTYMIHCDKYYYLDLLLYNYLRRSDSIMGKKDTTIKVLDILKIQEIIYQTVFINNKIDMYKEVLTKNYIVQLNHLFSYLPKKFEKQALNLIKKYMTEINSDDRIRETYNRLKIQRRKEMFEKLFSIKKIDAKDGKIYKVITILGIRLKFRSKYKELQNLVYKNSQDICVVGMRHVSNVKFLGKQTVNQELFYHYYLDLNSRYNNFQVDINTFRGKGVCAESSWKNFNYIFPDLKMYNFENDDKLYDYYFLWGSKYYENNYSIAQRAMFYNKPLYILEDGFLKSIDTWVNENAPQRYRDGVSFTVDNIVPYYDARFASHMELMLNDKELVITDEQKQRARKCIDKIIETHLTKYNHQPIFEPKIGREGVKKVLVVDQSYGDMSIAKGLADENTFKEMLECAIKENPDADIIVKTHPDTMAGAGGYYKGLKAHDNIYTQTEPINPISLIKYVDKVYVCTTQFGFEALMCGKEVHVFGMPFYAGWGLTHDRQKCERRTNTRTLEEVFYIAYIMYTYYVNPDKQCRCEIEEAMDYLLKLREEYLNE